MANNSALGSALSIPDGALEKIKKADERLQALQKTASDTAVSVKKSFETMQGSTKDFIGSLDQIITKLGTINSAAKTMSNSLGMGKTTQGVSKLGSAVQKTAETIEKLAASGRKATTSSDLSKSVNDWQNIQTQIDAAKKRQQELTQAIRQYELDLQRIQSGKGGVVTPSEYSANKQELEATKQLIVSLREKQQAIIANNQALNQQIQMVNALKSYKVNSGSLDNLRSKETLAQMREYYKELEKLSAQQAKADDKATAQQAKNTEKRLRELAREVNETEKANARLQKAKTSTPAYAQQYHNERQAMYNQLFGAQSTTSSSALASSSAVKTLREHMEAIKELQQARLNLDTTDKNYKRNLVSINDEIKRHSQVLKEAGVNTRNLGEQTSYLAGYMSRWVQRMAFAFSVGSITNFIQQLADVRGQFELSQISLESILQNKSKADEIFNKTVELAVKSPFRIKDLVNYTRQLSAYRIESDKLYDTTKRLADVAAGLGVDMGRLILAYGQVKAAAYLRGSEVRQFTEAGVNMYGELQSYFKEVKGEAYTTAQIVDLISKRKVTFEDVEAVFQRITDKGGIFYNMQEVQANTLTGKIANFKDAYDVMLNDIGKKNEDVIKGMISSATALLDHWQEIARVAEGLVGTIALLALYMKQMGATKVGMLFTGTLTAEAGKTTSTLGLLKKSFVSVTASVKNLAQNLVSAFAANAALLGVLALLAAIKGIYDAIAKYNEKVRKAKEETILARESVRGLKEEYQNLRFAATDAMSDKDSGAYEKNIKDRRVLLQKLIDTANKDGLSLDIDVEVLNADQINETFNKELKDYMDFIDEMEQVRTRYAKNDNWNTWVTDGLNDLAAKYKEYAVDFLSQSSTLETAIAIVNTNYDKATNETKKYFDEIKAGQKVGESNLDYFKRVKAALDAISEHTSKGFLGFGEPEWIEPLRDILDLKDIHTGSWGVDYFGEQLEKEFDTVFGNLKEKYKNDPVKMRAVIDKVAAENDWSEYERNLAYRHFGINISIDKANAEKQVDWVSNYIRDFFARKKYGINLVVSSIDDSSPAKGFLAAGDKAAQAAKDWKDVEKRLKSVGSNTDTIDVDDNIRKIFKTEELSPNQMFISVAAVRQRVSELKKAATEEALALGVNPFEKENNKANNAANKAQRDLLQERISLLKDMNSEYQKLVGFEGKEQALTDVRKNFALAAKNVGMSVNDFIPDKEELAKKIEAIANQYKDSTKRAGVLKSAAEIRLDVKEEDFKKQIEEAKDNAQESFAKLDLFKKLKEEGLQDEDIKAMFGDLTTSFEGVRNSITADFEAKWGKDMSAWGETATKEYKDQMAKLDKKIYDDQVNQAQELLKAYKEQLSEQLQLDKWYYEERMKIATNANLAKNPALQKHMQDNLTKEYNKKTADNTWKSFQNSDMYVRIFENLDHTSSKVLDYMIKRMEDLREQLKGLDPTQVKTITEQINKLYEKKNERNPFKALVSGFKELAKATKEYKRLGGDKAYISVNKQNDTEKQSINEHSKTLAALQAQYNEAVKIYGAESIRAQTLKETVNGEQDIIDKLKTQNTKTQENATTLSDAQAAVDKSKEKTVNAMTQINEIISSVGSAVSSLGEAFGVNMDAFNGGVEAMQGIGTAIKSYKSKDIAGMISGLASVASGLAKIFSGEGGIDAAIERQERLVSRLQHAYEKLQKAMENAWSTQDLNRYYNQSVDNLEAQIKSYEAMLKSEQSRKDPDQSKIQEYQQQIDDLKDDIKELGETMTEELGGFGSEANYKSAAQEFADAWVDAFNDSEDTLDALNDKMDEFFNNLIKKQIMMRAAKKILEPLFTAIDQAVDKESDGGYDLTKDELAALRGSASTAMTDLNSAFTALKDIWELTPTGSSNLSDLQQGIQSVTESTAQALESVLNSMRYFLATQQSDVAMIRSILQERLGSVASQSDVNPQLVVMREQAGYLKQIVGYWDSVVKSGHSKGRSGIRVFLD